MLKSGLIFGLIAFVLTLLTGNAVCGICFLLLLGLGAGYVAGRAERPLTSQDSLKSGAGAGAITGGLMLPALLIGGLWDASRGVMPGGALLYDSLGYAPQDPVMIWLAQIGVACCLGAFNLALLIGAGAAGGALWFQRRGVTSLDEPIPPAL